MSVLMNAAPSLYELITEFLSVTIPQNHSLTGLVPHHEISVTATSGQAERERERESYCWLDSSTTCERDVKVASTALNTRTKVGL